MGQLFTTSSEAIPACRIADAITRGVDKNLLLCVGGGLGDQICALPAVKYALENYLDCKVSVFTRTPELFSHLPLAGLFTFGKDEIDLSKYFVFQTYHLGDHFTSQFVSSIVMNTVDFCAVTFTRGQLPIKYRQPQTVGIKPSSEIMSLLDFIERAVFIHPGKNCWETRTFPAKWWEEVIENVVSNGGTPILIGAKTEFGGTVELSLPPEAIDLRDKTAIAETIWLLQRAVVLITNDSSPLHMAATCDPSDDKTGKAWIGFLGTARKGDHLLHFRGPNPGDYGFRMADFAQGGIWQLADLAPNKPESIDVRKVTPEILKSWLPHPAIVGFWAVNRWEGEPA